jgi:hypothetical protein
MALKWIEMWLVGRAGREEVIDSEVQFHLHVGATRSG